jgi:hypothetical protein
MKKSVKDLQPGDIVTITGIGYIEPSTQIILAARPAMHPTYYEFDMYHLEKGACWTNSAPGDMLVDVKGEPRIVTPEELAQLIMIANAYAAGIAPGVEARKQAADLANKLSPPNPPTYEELLEVTRRMCESPRAYADGQETPFSQCAKLVERARHAGLIK